MVIAFVNRPNGDFTFNGTARRAATRRPTSCSACRRSSAGRRQNQAQDGTGWLYSGYAQDEWRAVAAPDGQRGRALRAVAAVRRRERRAERVPSGRQSTRFPAAPRGPRLSGRSRRAARHLRRPTRTTSRRASASVWDPKGDGRSTLRGAWGIFYDALAGQGDFFQNGVLAPPFTPLRRGQLAAGVDHARESARVGHRRRDALPAGADFIGWGEDFQTPYALALQPDRAAARSGERSASRSATSDRAAVTCRSSWR